MSQKIKIVIADDHSILRQGTLNLLKNYEDLELMTSASSGDELLKLIEVHQPNVILSDIDMPGISIFEILEEIKRRGLKTKCLILSMHEEPEYILKAVEKGANGYLSKYSTEKELVQAIRAVAAGDDFFGQNISQIIIKGHRQQKDSDNPIFRLSKREKEVLSLIAEGLSTKQIADRLFVSQRTVSNHRANMLQKCEVNNSFELVRLYMENQYKI